VMSTKMAAFWVVAPCSLVPDYMVHLRKGLPINKCCAGHLSGGSTSEGKKFHFGTHYLKFQKEFSVHIFKLRWNTNIFCINSPSNYILLTPRLYS
jgi:hypothetical protein